MNISRDLSSTYLLEENWEDFVSNGIPCIVILSLIALVGTVGNLITCFVSFFRKHSTTHQTLVMFLAAVDLCSCIISIPLAALWIRFPFTYTSSEVCKLSRYFSIFLSTCSYVVLDIIAIERYGKVVWKPEKQLTPKQAKIICVSAYIACGVFVAIPALFVYGISERTTSKRHITGYECSVTTESRGTTFLKAYLSFGVLLVLLLFGCCFITYGLIGRRFILLSRSRNLKTSESYQKSIMRKSDPASAVSSNVSVSFNESEKYNHSRYSDTAQVGTVSIPEIVITDVDNELSTKLYMGVNNNDTQNHETCHCKSKVRSSIQSQQHSSNPSHEAKDTADVIVSETKESTNFPANVLNNQPRQKSSEITFPPSNDISTVNVNLLTCGVCSFDNRKRTVKFSTDIKVKTVEDQSRGFKDTVVLVERSRKPKSQNVTNNGKLGKKILRGKQITFMFFILSLISILSYLPYFVILLIRNMDWTMYEDIKSTLGPWEAVMWSFVYINNAINPVFYGFMDSSFRKDCKMFIEQVKYYVF
ncbi:uncharacterized protein LOC110462751 [Mizuhopecten yessoensis]|uniref:Neuropeptide S receptor n=1 Tax=Mizuhopecten yessoensis TaxID=6573 RepID=A0A210PXM6_MIZYE|nr:uncharacterized protein LOC110462751 [Mizuhopecten yessoensis]OWF41226.1 Neuropeptide S receptor [Mizuhopecten yessoensis]